MPTPLQRHRLMLTRMCNLVVHAHLSAAPSRHAHSCSQPSSRMPIQSEDHRGMLRHVGNVVAPAHLSAATSCHAHWCGQPRRAC
jgi:hypothetical protein